LQQSCSNDSDIGTHVRSLGVLPKDFDVLFELMDVDEAGEIPHQQFVQNVHTFKSHDALQTTLMMMRQMKSLKSMISQAFTTKMPNPSSEHQVPSCSVGQRSETKGSDASEHAGVAVSYDSLNAIMSPMTEDFTSLWTITDNLSQSKHFHSTHTDPTSEMCSKPSQHRKSYQNNLPKEDAHRSCCFPQQAEEPEEVPVSTQI